MSPPHTAKARVHRQARETTERPGPQRPAPDTAPAAVGRERGTELSRPLGARHAAGERVGEGHGSRTRVPRSRARIRGASCGSRPSVYFKFKNRRNQPTTLEPRRRRPGAGRGPEGSRARSGGTEVLRVPLGVTTSRVFGFLETHRVLPLSLRADRAHRADRADLADPRAASPCPAPHTLKSRLALGQRAELSSAGISRTFSAGDKEQGYWRLGAPSPVPAECPLPEVAGRRLPGRAVRRGPVQVHRGLCLYTGLREAPDPPAPARGTPLQKQGTPRGEGETSAPRAAA